MFRFVSRRSGRPLAAGGVSHRVVALAKRAGVRSTMHTLRKGFGCRYAGKVPAQVLQKLMRHRNIKTTMDYYANVDAAVEEAVLGGRREKAAAADGRKEKSAVTRFIMKGMETTSFSWRNSSRNKRSPAGRLPAGRRRKPFFRRVFRSAAGRRGGPPYNFRLKFASNSARPRR